MSICLIASNNTQGYYAKALMKWCTDKTINVHFPEKFNFGAYTEYMKEEDDIVIIFGFGYVNSQRNSVEKQARDASLIDTPYTALYHFASWGEEIDIPGVHSYVDEVRSPLSLMNQYLGKNKDQELVGFTKYSKLRYDVVQAIDDYHTYSFPASGNKTSLPLYELGELLRTNTDTLVKQTGDESLDNILKQNESLINTLTTNRESYMARRIATRKQFSIGTTIYSVLFAERYQNEIAHWLIEAYEHMAYSSVVLVGRHTRGDDMYQIRVSPDLDAAAIAKQLNNGKGKPQAATVFLGDSVQPTAATIQKIIEG